MRRLLILLILSTLVFGANIWGVSVYVLDEAKNSGCAMAMHQDGEWIVPTFNDELRTDKPPLHYFFMKAAYSVFGVNPFAARLFSSLMGVLTVLSVFFFTRRIANDQAAFFASLIILSSIQLAIQFHLAVPDPYLLFLLTSGWLSFYYGWSGRERKYLYAFYACAGLACLAKGPVALGFSGLLVLIFLLTQRALNFKELLRLRIVEGILIFSVIVLPWYILVGIETNGEWTDQFFFKHNVGRFTSTMEGHGGFPLASLVILVAGMMPFSFFIPQMIRLLWKEGRRDPFVIFCSCAAILVIVFFAFSRTILPTYPEPAFPFVAILLGVFFNKIIVRKKNPRLWINAASYLLVSLVIPLAVLIALKQDKSLTDLAWLSYLFLILPVGALIALVFIIRSEIISSLYVYIATQVVFLLVFFYVIFPAVDNRNPVLQSLPLTEGQSETVMYYKEINPAFIFAMQRSVPRLNSLDEVKQLRSNHPDLYLISHEEYAPDIERYGFEVIYKGQDLFEGTTTVILRATQTP